MAETPDSTDAIDLEEAARRLGISVVAARAAIERGLLNGFRDDSGRWKVWIGNGQGPKPQAQPQPERLAPERPAEVHRERPEPRPAEAPREAPRPSPSVAEIVERLMTDQLLYLRGLIDRHDKSAADKDALVADLMRRVIDLSRTAIHQIPGDAGLRDDLARSRAEIQDLRQRHERITRSVTDTLLLVRNYLTRRRDTARR